MNMGGTVTLKGGVQVTMVHAVRFLHCSSCSCILAESRVRMDVLSMEASPPVS